MNKNLHDIDKLFLQSLKDHVEEPSENTWQAIENELNRKDAALYKSKYTSLRRILICGALMCIFLLISYVLQFDLHNFSKKQTENVSPSNKNLPETKNNGSNSSTEPSDHTPALKKISHGRFSGEAEMLSEPTHQNENVPLSTLLPVSGNRKAPPFGVPELTPVKPGLNYSVISGSQKDLKPGVIIENEDQPTGNTMNSKKHKAKPEHSFYLIPYFSFDHVTAHFKQVYEPDDDMLPDTRKEKLDPSYTTGVLFEYGLSKKVSLQSGLLYSHWFASISPAVVKALQDNSGTYKFKLTTNYGFAEIKQSGITTPQSGDSVIVTDGFLNSQSFSIPVLLKLNFKPGKLNINGMAGGAINRMTRVVAEVEYVAADNKESETAEKLEGLRKTYFTVIAGAEATYPINKKISVGINPVIRYAITPVNEGTPVKTYPINIGVGASVRISLK